MLRHQYLGAMSHACVGMLSSIRKHVHACVGMFMHVDMHSQVGMLTQV